MMRLDAAQQALAAEHRWVAFEAARKYCQMWPWLSADFIGAAVVGVCRAALVFDREHGGRFSTLAYVYAVQEIKDERKRITVPLGYRQLNRMGCRSEDVPRIVSLDVLENEDPDVLAREPDDDSSSWDWFCGLAPRMSAKRRASIWETEVEGKSAVVVGKELGISEDAVRAHKMHGLKILRASLAG